MQIILAEQEEQRWFAPFLPQSMRMELAPAQLLYGAVEEQTGTAIGAMLVEAQEDGVELQWVCVADDWRRHGVARRLVAALCEDAADAPLVDTVRVLLSSQDEAAAALLRRCGFRVQASGYDEFSFPLSAIQQGTFLSRPVAYGGKIQPLGTVPKDAVDVFNARIKAGEKLSGVEPIRMQEYDSTLSLCCLSGGSIVGAVLVAPRGGALELSWLYADATQPRAAAALLQQAAGVALRLYPDETRVHLAALTEQSEALVRKLLPQAERSNGWIAWYYTASARPVRED